MFEELAKKMKKRTAVEVVFGKPEEPVVEEVVAPVVEEAAHKPSLVVDNANRNLEVKIINPEKFEDVITVANNLLEGYTVALNIELIDPDTVKRMLDFLHGVCFAIDGEVKFLSKNSYIITPSNVDCN